MTDEQFKRWAQFAIKMAIHCTKGTEARRKKVVDEVKSYFRWRVFQKDWNEIQDWDGNKDDFGLCDDVDDFFDSYRHWSRRELYYTGRFYNQVTCCIRAGFDIAVRPSGGVLGYTAGDIRKMFKNNVPGWVSDEWLDGEGNKIDFLSLSDETPLWL